MKKFISILLIILFLIKIVSINEQKSVIVYGSSTFSLMSNDIAEMVEILGFKYKNNSSGGQVIETISAQQGSNPIKISFIEPNKVKFKLPSKISINQLLNFGNLKPRGVFNVKLDNGIEGIINLNNNLFTPIGPINLPKIEHNNFTIDFGNQNYKKKSIHIFNIGKNNLSSGYTAEQVFNATRTLVNYIKLEKNDRYIVVGHFVNRDSKSEVKMNILKCNQMLRNEYGARYLDIQDYLISPKIWKQVNINPNKTDIKYQTSGELSVNLSKDKGHLNKKVQKLIVSRLKLKLIELKFI